MCSYALKTSISAGISSEHARPTAHQNAATLTNGKDASLDGRDAEEENSLDLESPNHILRSPTTQKLSPSSATFVSVLTIPPPTTTPSTPPQPPSPRLSAVQENDTSKQETAVTTRICKHSFGSTRLFTWLKTTNTCPVCRLELMDPPSPIPNPRTGRRIHSMITSVFTTQRLSFGTSGNKVAHVGTAREDREIGK
ncbi:hypothetical protein CC78DRAFT_580139 [Lojkania enalia]|uniref:RING-type domain-containing protein n=1 Tax=Lojkania enalia TaxID=147567 RepID=A0A9P4K9M6_9PLEO|nr:hypothetical protein CC78DRAFT_580139 [Didymosphaeria enalia]